MNVLFSVRGRINRLTFWEGLLAFFFLNLGAVMIEVTLFAVDWLGNLLVSVFNDTNHVLYQYFSLTVIFLHCLVASWILLAICAKRWHDLDRPGWTAVINILPILMLGYGCLSFVSSVDRIMIHRYVVDTRFNPVEVKTDAVATYLRLDPGLWHFFLAAAVVVAAFVYLGFFEGAKGANQYGKTAA